MNSQKQSPHSIKPPQAKNKGFALIVALTMMSFMVILVLSLATLLNVEMQTASHQNRLDEARTNALLGAQIALGQLQIHTGPDQRVTAPATIAYPPKNPIDDSESLEDIFRRHATALPAVNGEVPENWKTFLAQDWPGTDNFDDEDVNRDTWEEELDEYWKGKNPHWLGVWGSSNRDSNGDFIRDQTPRWLISGNENVLDANLAADQVTPDTDLEAEGIEYVELVGYHSAPTSDPDLVNEDAGIVLSNDGLDGRVIAPTVNILGADDVLAGKYAYWISDESLKANLALRDPFYTEDDPNTREYKNRLQVPQRAGWERVEGFAEIFNNYTDEERDAIITSPLFPRMASPKQIPLIDEEYVEPLVENFHNITTTSSSIFTDTARGGLQKDLFRFMKTGQGDGAIMASMPIPDPNGSDPLEYEGDPRFGPRNDGFPKSATNIPTWEQVYEWYNNEASSTSEGSIEVSETTFPVVSQVRLFFGLTTTNTGELRVNVWPQIVLWNPFDTGLDAEDYNFTIRFNVKLDNLTIATQLPDRTSTLDGDGNTVIDTALVSPDHPQVREYQNGDTRYPFYYHTINFDGVETDSTGTLSVGDRDTNKIYGVLSDETTVKSKDLPTSNFTLFDDGSVLALKIQGVSFAAGESLIFTVGDEQELTKSTINGKDALEVVLSNYCVEDNPPAAYFKIGTIDTPPYANPFGDERDHFMYSSSGTINGKNGLDLIYEAGGIELMNTRNFGGSFGGDTTKLFSSTRSINNLRDHPFVWRRLWSMDDPEYYTIINGDVDTGARPYHKSEPSYVPWENGAVESPLITVGESYIEPTYLRTWNDLATDGGAKDRFRAFANYNVMARYFETKHPMIDLARAGGAGDGFPDFEAIQSLKEASNSPPVICYYFDPDQRLGDFIDQGSASASRNRGRAWDASDGTRFKYVDGKYRGFSMLQPYQYDPGQGTSAAIRPKLLALDVLAVRPVRRADTEVLSIGQLQQINLSPFMWQPAFPIGNAEASPYIDREYISGIHSRPIPHKAKLTADRTALYDDDGYLQTFSSKQEMDAYNNGLNQLIDMSYILNDSIWDRYFLSSVPQSGEIETDGSQSLENGRIRMRSDIDYSAEEVRNVNNAARYLTNFGAFNVNSTSVEAWKALITGFRDLKMNAKYDDETLPGSVENPDDTVPVTRTLSPKEKTVDFAFSFDNSIQPDPSTYGSENGEYRNFHNMLNGFRYLTDDMIQVLAERIVDEVRLRGPFYSMSDFVNRRLVAPDYSGNYWMDARTNGSSNSEQSISKQYNSFTGINGLTGTLQRALNVSGINGGVNYPAVTGSDFRKSRDLAFYGHNNSQAASHKDGETYGHYNWRYNEYPSVRYYLDSEHKAGAPVGEQGLLLSHTPGFITQGDLLTMLAPALRPRGDTFVIRSYGSSISTLTGEPEAEAWLEMTVQRMPEPVNDPDNDYEPDLTDSGMDLGRKFEIIDLRWLTKDEV